MLAVKTTVTTSLLARVVVLNVVPLVPTLLPFNFHWYIGADPPLVGAAVNVTLVPSQIELSPSEDVTATAGVRLLMIAVVILLPLAVAVV